MKGMSECRSEVREIVIHVCRLTSVISAKREQSDNIVESISMQKESNSFPLNVNFVNFKAMVNISMASTTVLDGLCWYIF
jgi:hypothetical protein